MAIPATINRPHRQGKPLQPVPMPRVHRLILPAPTQILRIPNRSPWTIPTETLEQSLRAVARPAGQMRTQSLRQPGTVPITMRRQGTPELTLMELAQARARVIELEGLHQSLRECGIQQCSRRVGDFIRSSRCQCQPSTSRRLCSSFVQLLTSSRLRQDLLPVVVAPPSLRHVDVRRESPAGCRRRWVSKKRTR